VSAYAITHETSLVEEERMVPNNQPKLTGDQRRALVLDALYTNADKGELARRYGVSRSRVYQLLDDALYDPEGKLREAEAELRFRRRVLGSRHH
jgi:transposase-like protein